MERAWLFSIECQAVSGPWLHLGVEGSARWMPTLQAQACLSINCQCSPPRTVGMGRARLGVYPAMVTIY